MQKKTVAVLFGGVSSEYDVSLWSAASIIENIPKDKYEIVLLGITREGAWYLYTGSTQAIKDGTWVNNKSNKHAIISPDQTQKGIWIFDDERSRRIEVDCLFAVLHGANGEDGTMQGLFELSGIPYVGCNTLSSAICLDKEITHMIFDRAGIPHVAWRSAHRCDIPSLDAFADQMESELGYPMFVKPAKTGSSIGISKAKDKESFIKACELAFSYDDRVVIEQGLDAREIETAVLGNLYPQVAGPGEIFIGEQFEFYDYESKYSSGGARLQIPAQIPDSLKEEIFSIAKKAYRVMRCQGLARVDFFVTRKDSKVYLNELNTLPGFTATSMYPKMFEQAGVPYSELIDKLILSAFERNSHE